MYNSWYNWVLTSHLREALWHHMMPRQVSKRFNLKWISHEIASGTLLCLSCLFTSYHEPTNTHLWRITALWIYSQPYSLRNWLQRICNISNTMNLINVFMKHKIRSNAKTLCKDQGKISLLCTFAIFHAIQNPSWISLPLLKI